MNGVMLSRVCGFRGIGGRCCRDRGYIFRRDRPDSFRQHIFMQTHRWSAVVSFRDVHPVHEGIAPGMFEQVRIGEADCAACFQFCVRLQVQPMLLIEASPLLIPAIFGGNQMSAGMHTPSVMSGLVSAEAKSAKRQARTVRVVRRLSRGSTTDRLVAADQRPGDKAPPSGSTNPNGCFRG